MKRAHLLCLGGALGGATVGLYQNGGYDESLFATFDDKVFDFDELILFLKKKGYDISTNAVSG